MDRLMGSIALIAGTTIGAGMLTLPVATASMGFAPSALVFTLMALAMIYVGFLILEVLTMLPANATMISMAADTMGPWGKRAAAASYFFLLIALNVAYLAGVSGLFLTIMGIEPDILPKAIVAGATAFTCGWISAAHTQKVDRANRLLFASLIACYSVMLFGVLPYVEVCLLTTINWSYAISPVALILTSFGYHLIIPNIFDYLGRDIRKTKFAIGIGTCIPLCVYLLWQLMVMGNVPLDGEIGLLAALQKGQSATVPLAASLNLPWLSTVSGAFAIFAILTSFLGTMMALCEFVVDALGWNEQKGAKPKVALLLVGPLLLMSLFGSRLFISALEYAGVWAAVLIGCLPVLMAAIARYQYRHQNRPYLVKGGYGLMAVAFIAFTAIALVETVKHLGL